MATNEPPLTPPPDPPGVDAQITGIATLGDPVRRSLYRFVVAQAVPVNRDQAAKGVGVARHVAKFHLDRLVDDGLLKSPTAARRAAVQEDGATAVRLT